MTEIELSRRERKKEETRERIFQEAVRLFHTRGFENTTIDEITEKADVAKGTFFNYYPRKDAVLAYLSEKRLLEAEANAGAILNGSQSAREKLIRIYADAASAYEEDRELSRYVLLEVMGRGLAPQEEVSQRWHTLVVKVIEQGQGTGELRRDVDPVRAEGVLGSVYMATLYMWLCCPQEVCGTHNMEFPLQDVLRQRLTLVLEGLAS
jgi:AcrR family transcriptional regulator